MSSGLTQRLVGELSTDQRALPRRLVIEFAERLRNVLQPCPSAAEAV